MPTDREVLLEQLLIRAMVALHQHVVHCGTILDDQALEACGETPPTHAHDYRLKWEALAANE